MPDCSWLTTSGAATIAASAGKDVATAEGESNGQDGERQEGGGDAERAPRADYHGLDDQETDGGNGADEGEQGDLMDASSARSGTGCLPAGDGQGEVVSETVAGQRDAEEFGIRAREDGAAGGRPEQMHVCQLGGIDHAQERQDQESEGVDNPGGPGTQVGGDTGTARGS